MAINDFVLACAIDEVPAYFTYHGQTMLIVQSKQEAKARVASFWYFEKLADRLISHEAIHVAIKGLEGDEVSESLDDIEVVVELNGRRFQVTLNNILFASDNSGIVMP